MHPVQPEKEAQTYLKGKLFISTRPKSSSGNLKRLLENAGAELMELPMIVIKPVSLSAEGRNNLLQAATFDWIVFTSENGVRRFMEEYTYEAGGGALPPGVNLAAIGDKTASVLAEYGLSPDFTSISSNAAGFSDELADLFGRKHPRVLWPTGSLSPGILVRKLHGICDIRRLDLYETTLPDLVDNDIIQLIADNNYDIIFFFSPSAVRNFSSLAGDLPGRRALRAACIGPVTRETCLELGIEPLFMPAKPDSAELFWSTVDYYKTQQDK